MEPAYNLARDIIESSEVFRSAFDKNSDNYHHGDLTPVPIGGERVPDSMPTVYDAFSFNENK